MSISRLIFLSIVVILLLFSLTTWINFKQSEEVVANTEYYALSSNILRQSNQFQRNILYMERGLRGYLTTGENYFLQAYDSAFIENIALLSELNVLFPPETPQYQKLQDIQGLYNRWLDQFARPLRNVRPQPSSRLHISPTGKLPGFEPDLLEEERVNQDLEQKFRELRNAEYANRANRKEILEHSERKTKVLSFSLTVLSIVIGIVIAINLARYISRRILKMVNMADSIAEGNYNIQVSDTANDELTNLTKSLNHMANTLAESFTLLQRKNQELDQFAQIVSHDLKAPLRGIDNVVSWIEEDHKNELSPKVSSYLELIKGRITRSENLIQGILSYARIGKERLEKQQVDLNALMEEVLENIPLRPGLNIEIQQDLPLLHSEKLPLLQVFSNLLSNAVKYHDKPKGKIRVYSREEKVRYVFFVEDDGPGIAKPYHEKIFVIFQTLQERDSLESTGVGLAIVKKILDDRREHIHLESEPGKGSVFSFTWSKF